MTLKHSFKSESGYSITELLVSMAILVPIMAAGVGLFSFGVKQNGMGQNTIRTNQDARAALQIMMTEIAQAGSHPDFSTTLSASVTGSLNPQQLEVVSAGGFNVGDYVDIDSGNSHEIVPITNITGRNITGVFRFSHSSGTIISVGSNPYAGGVVAPAGMGPNATLTATSIRFYGHIQGDSLDSAEYDPTLQFVEYNYDAANNQITRAITPITQGTRNAPTPFIRNVKPGTAAFTLNSDSMGVVTSVGVSMIVRSRLKDEKYQETPISSRISIPSAIAGSALLWEFQQYNGLYPPPSTPTRIATWIGQ